MAYMQDKDIHLDPEEFDFTVRGKHHSTNQGSVTRKGSKKEIKMHSLSNRSKYVKKIKEKKPIPIKSKKRKAEELSPTSDESKNNKKVSPPKKTIASKLVIKMAFSPPFKKKKTDTKSPTTTKSSKKKPSPKKKKKKRPKRTTRKNSSVDDTNEMETSLENGDTLDEPDESDNEVNESDINTDKEQPVDSSQTEPEADLPRNKSLKRKKKTPSLSSRQRKRKKSESDVKQSEETEKLNNSAHLENIFDMFTSSTGTDPDSVNNASTGDESSLSQSEAPEGVTSRRPSRNRQRSKRYSSDIYSVEEPKIIKTNKKNSQAVAPKSTRGAGKKSDASPSDIILSPIHQIIDPLASPPLPTNLSSDINNSAITVPGLDPNNPVVGILYIPDPSAVLEASPEDGITIHQDHSFSLESVPCFTEEQKSDLDNKQLVYSDKDNPSEEANIVCGSDTSAVLIHSEAASDIPPTFISPVTKNIPKSPTKNKKNLSMLKMDKITSPVKKPTVPSKSGVNSEPESHRIISPRSQRKSRESSKSSPVSSPVREGRSPICSPVIRRTVLYSDDQNSPIKQLERSLSVSSGMSDMSEELSHMEGKSLAMLNTVIQ